MSGARKPGGCAFRVVEGGHGLHRQPLLPPELPDHGSPARGIVMGLLIMAAAFVAVIGGLHIAARIWP